MSIFTDTFNRANGALGGNWTASNANVAILNNWVSCSSANYWWAYNTTITGSSSRVSASARINARYAAVAYNGPAVKVNTTNGTGYYALVYYSGGTYYLRIGKGALTAAGNIASQALPYAPPGAFTITIEYDDGHITASIPGLATVEADDTDYITETGFAIRGFATTDLVDSCTFTDGAAATFTVSPSPIGNYGTTVALTFTGTQTEWETTTPTFTVDHGTLSNQSITDDTTATATYDPADFLGTATFTDPSTGAYDQVTVTSDPGVVNPGGVALSETAIEYIERSAAAETEGTIANREMDVAVSGPSITLENAIGRIRLSTSDYTYSESGVPGTNTLIDTLWRLINGGYDPAVGPFPTPAFDTLDAGLAQIKADLDDLMGVSEWTLPDLIGLLAGDPVASNRDIMTAIAALDFDDTAILNAIYALRGAEGSTVEGAITLIQALSTIAGYDLSDVQSWIEASRGPTLPTIEDTLTSLSALSTQLDNAVSSINANVDTDTSDIPVMAANIVNVGLALVDVANVVAEILGIVQDLQAATPKPVPPIWPGLAGVTVSETTPLSDGLTISGPFHGLIITLTGYPTHAGRYAFGAVMSWQHAGSVIFANDRGEYERALSIGLDSQILAPLTMTEADHAILRLGSGWTGTVRTWTINP